MKTVITIPGIMFMNRKLYLEGGVYDPEGQKLAMALGQILREKLLNQMNKSTEDRPLIIPGVVNDQS